MWNKERFFLRSLRTPAFFWNWNCSFKAERELTYEFPAKVEATAPITNGILRNGSNSRRNSKGRLQVPYPAYAALVHGMDHSTSASLGLTASPQVDLLGLRQLSSGKLPRTKC